MYFCKILNFGNTLGLRQDHGFGSFGKKLQRKNSLLSLKDLL